MRRIPIFATIIVALAIATMIGLGIWQIERATWKEGLLASYRAAAGAPMLDGLPTGADVDRIAFRRASLQCRTTSGPTLLGGPGPDGQTGFRSIVGCALPDGRAMMADLGWHKLGVEPALPPVGTMVVGRGALIPDDVLAARVFGRKDGHVPLLLVLENPVPGFAPSTPPSVETIPNNHRSYAVQWFLFAAVAGIIYALALWKRLRG